MANDDPRPTARFGRWTCIPPAAPGVRDLPYLAGLLCGFLVVYPLVREIAGAHPLNLKGWFWGPAQLVLSLYIGVAAVGYMCDMIYRRLRKPPRDSDRLPDNVNR